MATFLKICQDTAREMGIAGTGPTTVLSQTGELANVVRWVINSYEDIQNRNHGNWRFLRKRWTIDTTAEDGIYSPSDITDIEAAAVISRFGHWHIQDKRNPPQAFLTSGGVGVEFRMIWTVWEDFKYIYRLGTQVSSKPIHIGYEPNNDLVLGPVPSDIYTVTGEYYRSAQILAADADVPEMPTQFHNLIMYYAIEHYGYREAAAEVLERAHTMGRRYMRQMEADQLAKFRKAGTLA